MSFASPGKKRPLRVGLALPLWSGTAIPEGGGKYRFSWQGGDPKTASYWGVSLSEKNTKLVFAGTNQTYTKAVAHKGKG